MSKGNFQKRLLLNTLKIIVIYRAHICRVATIDIQINKYTLSGVVDLIGDLMVNLSQNALDNFHTFFTVYLYELRMQLKNGSGNKPIWSLFSHMFFNWRLNEVTQQSEKQSSWLSV